MSNELPLWQSHKQVRAFKIKETFAIAGTQNDYAISGFNGEEVTVDGDWLLRVTEGDDSGYFVEYDDGYTSWSPTKAFEEGYTLVECLENIDEKRSRDLSNANRIGYFLIEKDQFAAREAMDRTLDAMSFQAIDVYRKPNGKVILIGTSPYFRPLDDLTNLVYNWKSNQFNIQQYLADAKVDDAGKLELDVRPVRFVR